MTPRTRIRIAGAATGCAIFIFLVCLAWIAVISPYDWAALVPFYGMIFVAQPLAFLGIVFAVWRYRSQPRNRVVAFVFLNSLILIVPWVWLAIAT